MSGYAFHPDAFADLDEIWEYIAQDNIDAADRVLADIHTVLRTLAGAPHIGHRRPDQKRLGPPADSSAVSAAFAFATTSGWSEKCS